MRKKFILLAFLLLLPVTSGINISEQASYKIGENLRDLEVSEDSIFATTKSGFMQIENGTKIRDQNFGRPLSWEIDFNSNYVLTGTRGGFNSDLLLLSRHNRSFRRYGVDRYVDGVSLVENENSFVPISASGKKMIFFNPEGTRETVFKSEIVSKHPLDSANDIDLDGEREILVPGGGNDQGPIFQVVELDGDLDWRTDHKSGRATGGFMTSKGILIYWNGGLELRSSNGSVKWEKREEANSKPVVIDKKIVYSQDKRLIFRSLTGEKVSTNEIDHEISSLAVSPDEKYLVGYQEENATFFSDLGQKKHSFNIGELKKSPKFSNFDRDGKKELIAAAGHQVKVFNIDRNQSMDWDFSLNDTVFVGKDRSMLEAVALNSTAYVSNSTEKIQEENVLGVGLGSDNSTENANKVFNRTGCVFVKDRVKAVYASALAAKNDSCLSFSRERSSSSLVNKSLEDVKNRFIEVFDPNHVVVADLDSKSGVLVAEMAVKQGVYPVNFDENFSYRELNSTTNKYNGVIQLEEKIKNAFEKIGENPNTVFEGKHISLLNAPRKVYEDPVEKGILFSDKEDGKHYLSDLNYGDLDNDSFLEAGVGRYPSNTLTASKLFHRSLEREVGGKAVLGSEYLHEEWPVVLTTFGGGLRHGSSVENVLRKEGYNTTHFVERRAEPLQTLYSLTPSGISTFLKNTDRAKSFLDSVGSSAGSMAKTGLTVIRGLKFAEEGLEMLYEYKWRDYEFNLDRGLKRMEDWEVPLGKTPTEVIQKGVIQVFYNFLWPESHPRLEKQGFLGETRGSDIIYFQGVGNSSEWKLPSNNKYNVSVGPSDIPELERPIVWDSTFMAGKKDAEMRSKFIEKGASAHLGFSTVNYAAFSSIIDSEFFKKGKNLGTSLRLSVNSLRETGLVYNPTSFHKNGVKKKMESSLSLMGNPEMPKDPIDSKYFEFSKSCGNGVCTLNASLRPEIEFDSSTVRYNSSSELVETGMPITPLYSFSEKTPGQITQVETKSSYSEPREIKVPKAELLTTSGNYVNISRKEGEFPTVRSNSSRKEGFRFVQSGMIRTGEGFRIVINASVEIKYESPVTISVEPDSTPKTEVYSNSSRKAVLAYRINGERTSREIVLDEGVNTFDLPKLKPGIHSVKAAVIYDDRAVETSKKFRGERQPEVKVLGSVKEAETTSIEVSVENTNNFSITREVNPELGSDLIFSPLEKERKTVSLEPGESESIGFSVVGLKEGISSFEVLNQSFQLKQAGADREKMSKSFSGIHRSVSSGATELNFRSNSSSETGSIRSPGFELSYRKTSGKTVYRFRTPSYTVSRIEGLKQVYRVSTDSGSAELVKNSGLSWRNEGLERKKVLELVGTAEEEFSKLDKFRRAVSVHGRPS